MTLPAVKRPGVGTFAEELIRAGQCHTDGIRWQPFQLRTAVVAELSERGFELAEDGATHDPQLRRFFAVPKKEQKP